MIDDRSFLSISYMEVADACLVAVPMKAPTELNEYVYKLPPAAIRAPVSACG
jgi:hypothetical protein